MPGCTPPVRPRGRAWKALLAWVLSRAELDWPVVDHDPPATLAALRARHEHDILRFHEPALAAGARVLETTAPTPIPPFVATGPVDDATLGRLQDSFLAVADERSLDRPRAALQLRGFAITRPEDYELQRRRAETVEASGEEW